jgi:hypothetical protein
MLDRGSRVTPATIASRSAERHETRGGHAIRENGGNIIERLMAPGGKAMRPCLRGALLAALTAVFGIAGAAHAAVVPVSKDAAGATQLAEAMTASPTNVAGATFDAVPPLNNPNGIGTAPLNSFPTNGPSFAILTSGEVSYAPTANTSGSTTAVNGGAAVRGNTDRDVTILRVNVVVPQGANCLSFDFKFLSEEYPEWVGSSYNDAFIAELDNSTWTTSGSTIYAPNNFAFDPSGNVISINSTGATAMSAAQAAGTTYDGATPLLSASTQVTPGPHVLYLSIFDQGDAQLDSAVFLDNLVIGFVPNPQTQCTQGAQPKVFNLTLSPATATNPVGTSHSVTATLTESGTPVPSGTVSFTVTGAHTTGGTATTNASGQATFAYAGTVAGTDTIVACYDADANGTCGNPGDPLASATKEWEAPADTTKPSCAMTKTGTNASGKKYIEVTVQGSGSGLASIVATKSTNAVVTWPPFANGTTSAVIVTGTKVDNAVGSVIELRVTDVAGNITVCDPVIELMIRSDGKPTTSTHTGIPAAEHLVLVENGTPGLTQLELVVNGKRYQVSGLADGATRQLSVADAMKPGNTNTISLTARGKPGASALVVISD